MRSAAGLPQDRRGQDHPGQGFIGHAQLLQARLDLCRRVGDIGPARLPELLHLLQDLQEARPALAAIRREIGPAEERLAVRREEDIQRPAALAARRLDEGHVDLVHVRPLLPVHLDADEMLVEERRELLVLEGLALHDMAPVAGRIADAQEDGLVLALGFGEGLVAPGKPIHRVVLVLEEVGRFLPGQAVGMRGRSRSRARQSRYCS